MREAGTNMIYAVISPAIISLAQEYLFQKIRKTKLLSHAHKHKLINVIFNEA